VVKKIAQLYDGTVSVESRPDEGSTFKVELQRHTTQAVNTAGIEPIGPAGDGGQRKP
jgi:light-regulated signal transduction histidine kinase (bacteriophytochrome)